MSAALRPGRVVIRAILAGAGAIVLSIPQVAASQPVPPPAAAFGPGDICHPAGKPVLKCRSYPGRIGYHRSNCHWVEQIGAADHQFEVCRDPDGVWRPSGRD
jgi:hypothetical protein